MSGMVMEVSDDSFSTDVLNSVNPVLVCFRAEWSGVCRAADPMLVEIAQEYSGRMVMARLDIDRSPKTPPEQDVTAIPTYNLYKKGSRTTIFIGPTTKDGLKERIDSHL